MTARNGNLQDSSLPNVFADAPELSHDPRSFPPEVYAPSAPEANHNPQDFPPEVLSGPVFGTADEESPRENDVSEKSRPRKRWCTRWRWVALIAIIVIVAAAIGGGVGGTRGKSKRQPASAATTSPPAHNSSIPSDSSTTPALSPTILSNASIAATICPNGDRYVFFQDIKGILRVAQWSSTSDWAVRSNDTIPSNARSGTSLSASCVSIPVGLASDVNPGRFISLVYLNASADGISQSIYTNGGWNNLPVPQASLLPANNTRLSASTNVVSLDADTHLSSLVVYKSKNGTLVMIDLISELDVVAKIGPFRPLSLSPNIFDRLDNSSSVESFRLSFEALPVDAGLACSCDQSPDPIEKSSSHLFTQCFQAQQGPGGGTAVAEQYWAYNQTIQRGGDSGSVRVDSPAKFRMDVPWASKKVSADEVFNADRLFLVGFTSEEWNGTSDISSFRLAQHRTGIVYLLPNNTIQLQIGSTSSPGDAQGILGNTVSPLTPSIIPSNHFSAASSGEKALKLYIYYQANETSLAEISFDTDNGVWSQPLMINVP
ncbi:hypothetical protein MMC22_003688 [Lobaria immixta]|nr:hypothetical protein [Lobaria immixta]